MKYYNSLENVNSKKTIQPPKNLQRKTHKKDRGMIEGHEEGFQAVWPQELGTAVLGERVKEQKRCKS